MKRQQNDTDTRVYQYRLSNPLEDLTPAMDVLYKQNKLWNSLVEIERAARARYREILSGHTQVADLETQLTALRDQRASLIAERKLARKQARRRVPTPDLDAAILALKTPIQMLSADTKAARVAARSEMKPALDALEQERREQVKAATNARALGLWWPNVNAVRDSYETARVRAMRDQTELKFHRFDGSGRFSFQVQGGMSVAELMDGAWNQVAVSGFDPALFSDVHSGKRRLAQSRVLRFAIDSDQSARSAFELLTFRMQYHRPLPDEARIKFVTVTRRRIGTHWQWHVAFTCVMPAAVGLLRTNIEKTCALNLGFRLRGDGSLRVGVRVAKGESRHEYVLPAVMLDRLAYLDELLSQRDAALNEILPVFRQVIGATADEAWERARKSIQSPKIGAALLASFALRLREQVDIGFVDELARIEAWRKADKLVFNQIAHLRAKLAARRTDLYRSWAAEVTRRYGTILLEDTDYRAMAVKEHTDGTETAVPTAVRRNARFAAPGEFRKYIQQAAAKQGAVVEIRQALYRTLRCHACGHSQNLEDGNNARENLLWKCGHCGETWDQDENFALNLLKDNGAPTQFEHSDGDSDPGNRSRDETHL